LLDVLTHKSQTVLVTVT